MKETDYDRIMKLGEDEYLRLSKEGDPYAFHRAVEKVNRELGILKSSEWSEWFFKGRKSVFSKNKSGCCCIFDNSDIIISVCRAHQDLLANAIKGK